MNANDYAFEIVQILLNIMMICKMTWRMNDMQMFLKLFVSFNECVSGVINLFNSCLFYATLYVANEA